jgi:hypothetical protein
VLLFTGTVIVSKVLVPIERGIVTLASSGQTSIGIFVWLRIEVASEDLHRRRVREAGKDGGREGRSGDLKVSLTFVQSIVPNCFD